MSQTLQRAITILELVSEEPRRIGQIAKHLGVHHSTALRLVHTLRDNRLLLEQPDHAYRLGSGLLGLANRALEQIDLRDVAKPHMVTLGKATLETIHLGVMEGNSVVYLDKVEASHPVRMYSRIGATAPLHCTAVAKAILAHSDPDLDSAIAEQIDYVAHTPNTITTAEGLREELAWIRSAGYALDREEHELGIHCIAAPLREADGRTHASISISAPSSRISRDQLKGFAPDLKAATAAISRALGQDGQ